MPEEILAALISVGILLALFLWIPTLEVCGPKCQKFFRTRQTRRAEAQARHTDEELITAPLRPQTLEPSNCDPTPYSP